MYTNTGTLYLTEKTLENVLEVLFPNEEIFHDNVTFVYDINGKTQRFRPDFVLKNKNLVVEFDGPTHYTNHNVVLRDLFADVALNNSGWNVVHIPYFFQPTPKMLKHLFGVATKCDMSNDFPHGFIADRVIRPTNFCLAGLGRYASQLSGLLGAGLHDEYKSVRATEITIATFKHVGDPEKAHETCQIFSHTLDMAELYFTSLQSSICRCAKLVDIKHKK